jgi:hypothetical protein
MPWAVGGSRHTRPGKEKHIVEEHNPESCRVCEWAGPQFCARERALLSGQADKEEKEGK